jgi:peroxiredoxin
MRADILAGAVFPDYALTDHTGKHRKLSELQGPDPMILVLSRGGYCPKDRRQAEGLVQLHHEMEVGYSRLVTISTDNMLLTNEYRTGAGARWTFLSDPGRKVQKDLDIAEYTDPDHNPMIPHVIVLEPGLVIFKVYNGYWFFGRPTVEELRQDLYWKWNSLSLALTDSTMSPAWTARTHCSNTSKQVVVIPALSSSVLSAFAGTGGQLSGRAIWCQRSYALYFSFEYPKLYQINYRLSAQMSPAFASSLRRKLHLSSHHRGNGSNALLAVLNVGGCQNTVSWKRVGQITPGLSAIRHLLFGGPSTPRQTANLK